MPGEEALLAALLAGTVGWTIGHEGKIKLAPLESQVVDTLRNDKPELIKEYPIDLSVARNAQEVVLTGTLIYVENPNDVTGPVYIQLNEPESAQIDLTKQRRIKGTFYRFFITNAAGTGTLNLRLSRSKFFQFDESQLEIKIVAQSVNIDMQVVSSIVQMPIDLQSSYIMMPIDIQAQYMDLKIDINAQSIGNLSIDINAQTVGDLTINVAAQNIAVKGLADWGTVQGLDWNPPDTVASPGIVAGNWGYTSESGNPFQVPTGKIWYVYGCSVRCYKHSDSKTPVAFAVNVEAPSGSVVDLGTKLAGEGYYARFTRPIRIIASQKVRFNLLNLDATNAMGATVIVNTIQVDA